MKTSILILILILTITISGKTQSSDKISGFSDIKFSYNISSMSAGGHHFKKDETIIPWGAGIESSYNITKRLSTDFGIEFRTTANRVTDGFIISEFGGYSGPVHTENRDIYIDIPIHLSFKFININLLKIQVAGGLKATFQNVKYYSKTSEESRYQGTYFDSGLDIGLVENVKITKRTSLFLSQFYGYYISGNLAKIEMVDLKIGFNYYFKH